MTYARLLTARGRGAIAVVEVTGPDAVVIVQQLFEPVGSPSFTSTAVDAIRFGGWRSAATVAEELVVVRTGEDRVEVHCHGGLAAPGAILASLEAAGVKRAEQRAASLAEQALADLAHAPTERVAGILLDQANGALGQAIAEAIQATERGDAATAETILHQLLQLERLAMHLLTPWRVVLAGSPNVGKSSLINALVGFERALVFDQPGTTRDAVTGSTAIGGWPITLIDTAGIRETDDPLESAGVRQARDLLQSADLVLHVEEAARLQESSPLLQEAIEVPVLQVASKVDLLKPDTPAPTGWIATSTVTGGGVPELLTAIESALAIPCPQPGTAMLFRSEHFAVLQKALEASPADRQALLQSLLAGR